MVYILTNSAEIPDYKALRLPVFDNCIFCRYICSYVLNSPVWTVNHREWNFTLEFGVSIRCDGVITLRFLPFCFKTRCAYFSARGRHKYQEENVYYTIDKKNYSFMQIYGKFMQSYDTRSWVLLPKTMVCGPNQFDFFQYC